jgi:HK97 family phage prohead protease
MPLPKPRKGQSQSDFMAACMHEAFGSDAPKDRTQQQAIAMCMGAWREAHPSAPPPPKKADDDKGKAKKPYGEVEYADPGYQEDKKKRYPIDTEAHIRAAWNYINKPKNAAKYSSENLAKVKAKIVAAWKKVIDKEGPPSAADNKKQQIERVIRRWHDKFGRDPSVAILARFSADDIPEPDDDESKSDFLDRCQDEIGDGDDDDDAEEACEQAWEDAQDGDDEDEERRAPELVHKAHSGEVDGVEFVLSDDSIDRMGDVIVSEGWDLASFKRNPVCLFNHSAMLPIGKWENLRVEKGELRGHLQLAPEGTSPRIDEIRRLVDAGILRAVSVGFRPLESGPRHENGKTLGMVFTKSELVETSLVSVPANRNALAVAKSLRISPATQDLVFGGKAYKDETTVRRGLTGGHAKTARSDGGGVMSLTQRISDLQTLMVDKRDELESHLEKQDDSNISDSDLEKTQTLNAEIAQLEKQHAALVEAEKRLAKTADGGGNSGSRSRALATTAFTQPKNDGGVTAPLIIPNARKKDLDPIDLLVRAGTISYVSKVWNQTTENTRLKIYGDDEGTKIVSDIILRAPSAPAMTNVVSWAQELVQVVYSDLLNLLLAKSIYTRLAAKGLSLSFGRAGKINIPARSRTPTIAGSFVGEGQAIPVRMGAFTTQTLVPKKMAVISVWSREMDEHSIPAIEGVLREAVQEDTSVALDSVLIDTNAATAIRPPGLLNGVTATTATAGGGLDALIGDIKALVGALSTNTYGNVRSPVWIANQVDMLSAGLAMAANTGIFPFRDEVAAGRLANIPIIDSATVPAKTLILVDAADFVAVGGEAPRFELSDQATLHMDDSAPAELVGTGSPGAVASPQRSLWQTDSIALRMIMPMNWWQRRPGTIAYTTGITW